MTKKIIFVPGIFNPKWYQSFWRKEAKKYGFEFVEFENPRYSYWSLNQMQNMVERGVELFEKSRGDEVYVVCHSFGGILVNCILQRLKNYKIKKLVILASPLQMNFFGMRKRKEFLAYDSKFDYKTEIFSFGGYFDWIVSFSLTKYGSEKHFNVFGEHLCFLFSRRVIRRVLSLFE